MTKNPKTPTFLASTPVEIAQLFFQHADHEQARHLTVEIARVLERATPKNATNALALAGALVAFIYSMPDKGVDAETLDGILTLAHSILAVNGRKEQPKMN